MTQTDREALVALYNATGGPSWNRNRNWKTDADLSQWHGIETDDQGRVVRLTLNSNNLQGSIPSEVGKLAALQLLNLSKNQLTGTIPEALGALSQLRQLWLGGNQLSGQFPPQLGDLRALVTLDLGWNKLDGRIPAFLGTFAALEYLDLSQNNLTGPIPLQLGDLLVLKILWLSHNKLEGSIPRELGKISALEQLNLGNNQLSGSIPRELGKINALEQLNLENNQLSGPIPPEMGKLAALMLLKLQLNQLTGSIPPELGNLAGLTELNLGANKLSGPIPPQLGQLGALKILWLSHNKLEGPIPAELGMLTALENLQLKDNQLSGPIPPELGYLAALANLNLLGNLFSGPIPPELGNPAALANLNLHGNLLSDTEERTPGVPQPVDVPQSAVEYDYYLPIAAEAPSGTDALNYKIYVKSLADLFSNNDHNVLPAAVGIYAPWGSGKTFLLELLEEELLDKKNQHREPQNGCLEKSCCCCCPKVLERRFLVVVARFLLREIGKWVNQRFCCHSTGGLAAEDPETGGNGSLSGQKGARKFIFVKFNAWEYGDSEVLWAALASKIFTAVENHEDFGQGVVREKRVVELLDKRIWDWCGLCVFFIIFVLLGIITVFLVEYTTNAISDITQEVVALAASVVGALVLTMVKFLLQVRARGVFDTAQGVLRKAYEDGKKSVGDGHLGFMSEIKEELRILFELIGAHNTTREGDGKRGVTVAVIIDDLDRCAPDKILHTLQATHLLLQQPEAQMVVFLAVDPRIIVSAIDKKLEDVPDEVNGLVYLEKIIHIPFCLPQISKEDQRKYLRGLLSEEPPPSPSPSLPNRPEGAASTSSSTAAAPTTAAPATAAPTTAAPVTGPETSSAPISTVPSTGSGASQPTPEVREIRRALTAAERTVFTAVLENIKATPRKIKRAVNVYVLQRSLAKLNGLDDDKLPALVKWSILSEFWPCRVSGIAFAVQNGREVHDITIAYNDSVRGNQDKEKLRPLYLIDGPEGSFLDALGVEDTPTISSVQVREFLPYSVGLNSAIVSAVEAAMREAPVVEAATTREAGVQEAKTGGSAE